MRYFYYAASATQNKNEFTFVPQENPEYIPGNIAFVIKVPDNENLKSVLDRYGGLFIVQPCKTKTEAESITEYWNKCYKENGSYLYSE